MKKFIAFILAGTLLFLGCAHHKDLTEEEREAYRKSMETYYKSQRGGP